MKIYNYDANGLFIGESIADESPIEENVHLVPNFATVVKPLEAKQGFDVVFDGSKWNYIEYQKVETIKPVQPNVYSVWDNATWEWVEDVQLKTQYELSQKLIEANAYLVSTDWVTHYIVLHKCGIEILPDDSNKLAIEAKRVEAIAFIRENEGK